MKIMLICSAAFNHFESEYAEKLRYLGHEVYFTSGYDEPKPSDEDWLDYGARMMRKSIELIPKIDAVLCLNFDKNGRKNYIGGATLCEMAYAFEYGKKIYVLNDIPEDYEGGASVRFEIEMFRPVVMKGRLEMIK